jgi:hypothetical protein
MPDNVFTDADISLVSDDVGVSPTGDVQLIGGDNNLLQTAFNNMKIRYGESEYHPTRGNMIFSRRLKMTEADMAQVEQDCKNAILFDSRVADVPYIKVTQADNYGCYVQFKLKKSDNTIIDGDTIIYIGG